MKQNEKSWEVVKLHDNFGVEKGRCLKIKEALSQGLKLLLEFLTFEKTNAVQNLSENNTKERVKKMLLALVSSEDHRRGSIVEVFLNFNDNEVFKSAGSLLFNCAVPEGLRHMLRSCGPLGENHLIKSLMDAIHGK